MSIDADKLEAAVRRDDSGAVRDLLRSATEYERAECAKTLRPLLREPPLPELSIGLSGGRPAIMTRSGVKLLTPQECRKLAERRTAHEQWQSLARGTAFFLASIGLAGGVAVATRLLQHGREDVDLVAAVLADRRPDWLAEAIGRHLKFTAQFALGTPAWPLARRLVRLGAIPRPAIPEYGTQMPSGVVWVPDPDRKGIRWPEPEQALLADPGLLDDEVWLLFTVPDVGRVLQDADARPAWMEQYQPEPSQTWSQALAQLCTDGLLDRDRLLDACLGAFTRDFAPSRVAWYGVMHDRLDPSADEIAGRAASYYGLLAATSKTGVTVGQAGAGQLLAAERLDAGRFIDASEPALLFPQKAVVTAQLKLIDAVIRKHPDATARALAVVATAFGHDRQDIQEAALALIGKHGLPDGAAGARIRQRAADLSPGLAGQAADLGIGPAEPDATAETDDALDNELAEIAQAIGALPPERAGDLTAALTLVRERGIPGPAHVAPAAGAPLPGPVTDPEELVQLFAVLLEDAGDPIMAERAMAGAVRLSALPERDRRKAAGPLAKRVASVMNIHLPFDGQQLAEDFAVLAHVWSGGKIPSGGASRDDWYRPGMYPVDKAGRARWMTGIFTARAWDAARIIIAGAGGQLLAEPDSDRGAISPQTLLSRLSADSENRHAGVSLVSYDRDLALLRLAPGAEDELWALWAEREQTTPEELRDAHRLSQAPVRYEAVIGTVADLPLRGYGESEPLMLARPAGAVPAIPSCPAWQLLAGLSDPLSAHAIICAAGEHATHYETAVAGWHLLCPWQPETAAAYLLHPLSEALTLRSRTHQATAAITALRHPGHPLGIAGHLALAAGLGAQGAETRIAAAQLWADAAADGRLDPALAAQAISAGVHGKALKLNRVTDSLRHAAQTPIAAWRVVQTVARLAEAPPAGLHTLLELTIELGDAVGFPDLPDAVKTLAAKPGSSRVTTVARRLVQAHDIQAAGGQPTDRQQAAVQALRALLDRVP